MEMEILIALFAMLMIFCVVYKILDKHTKSIDLSIGKHDWLKIHGEFYKK